MIFLLSILISASASSSPTLLMMYFAYNLKKQGDNTQPWRTSFPIWSQSVVPWPNCCFLTYIQVSQEAGQVIWNAHLYHNFPQFIVIHTVEGFGIVKKAEIDVFQELSCFFDNPSDVACSLVPLTFLKPAWTSGCSRFTYCCSLTWRILSLTLLACEMSAIVW